MALRSNSKKAVQNIRNYIISHFGGTNYSPDYDNVGNDFNAVAAAIRECFTKEYIKPRNKVREPRYELFRSYCAGLPSIIDTCYYYNRSAVDDLAAILEETKEEAARFTESEAEEKLTYLIYRELFKA